MSGNEALRENVWERDYPCSMSGNETSRGEKPFGNDINMDRQLAARMIGRFSQWCPYILSWIFLVIVVTAFVSLIILNIIAPLHLASRGNVSSSVVDKRCKCVCPHNLTVTNKYNTTVFQKTFLDPADCQCERVLPEYDDVLCLRCECSFESRNVFLLTSIVVMVLVVIIGLCGYSVFVCLQPFLWKRDERNGRYDPLREDSPHHDIRVQMQQIRWRQQVADQRLQELRTFT